MTGESVLVILALPNRILSPNAHIGSLRGRFMKAAATKKYRRLAKEATLGERVDSAPWQKAVVTPVFFHARKGRRDDDNFVGSLKAVYDGIVDAGLLPDDDSEHMTKMPPKFLVDKENPRVEITVTRLE